MKRTLAAAGRIAPLLRAGLIAGVVVAGRRLPARRRRRPRRQGRRRRRAAACRDELTVVPAGADHLRLRQRRQDAAHACSTRSTASTTTIADMSPYIQQAIVASEDTRFYEHNGVDAKGVARAFVANQQAGGVSQGASTLTMQYVRMALRDGAQTPAGGASRPPSRPPSASCARCGWRIELEKQRLQAGDPASATSTRRTSGTGRTASTPPRRSSSPRPRQDLTLAEAATLAGLVKAPSAYDPAGAATSRRPPTGATTSSTRC